MKFFTKYKIEIFAVLVIIVAFFASRLYNILGLPIFTDEAIYIRWAQIANQDANWRFISLTDGKQPSFVWFAIVVMRFVSDPLLAGRLVSVAAGFFTMVGLFFVGRELFRSNRIGIVSSFLYVVFPMGLVYDRMALYDSLVGMFAVWAFYFASLLVKKVRLDVALVLGMVIGGGVLTKTNAFFSLPLLLFSTILFDWKNPAWKSRLLKLLFYMLIVFGLSMIFYSVLRLSPFFHIIAEKNAMFAYPLKEWLEHPTEYFLSNTWGLFDWLITYFTLPLFLLVISAFLITRNIGRKQALTALALLGAALLTVGTLNVMWHFRLVPIRIPLFIPYVYFLPFLVAICISVFRKYPFWKEKILLVLWFIVPFVYLAFFGKTIYPRFIFFMVILLLPLAAFSLSLLYQNIKRRKLLRIVLLAFLILPLWADYKILTDFATAPLPAQDLRQYNNDWPAGGGVKEAVEFFRRESERGKIFIATQGTFGLMPYAFEIYLVNNPNIEIKGYWPITENIPAEVVGKSKKMPTYFVFYQPCEICKEIGIAPSAWNAGLVRQYKKPIPKRRLSIYRIQP